MENEKLKLFISYSHTDEQLVSEFIKHIAPLKANNLIDEWYDRKIIAGQEFQDTIDNNLDSGNILCLFISANFLSSPSCLAEKNRAIGLRKKKGVPVVPIVLSECGWLDVSDISVLLALPPDGKAISKYSDINTGWYEVYKGLKDIIEEENKIRKLKITNSISEFLKNTDLFTKAHSQKREVYLDDIFVYPEFEKYDDLRDYEKRVSSESVILNFSDYSKILISGEDQSGKTTLCKKLFTELRKKNYVPIYVANKINQYQMPIETKIKKAFDEQYKDISFTEISKKRLVPIIDDFHYTKKKENYINDLKEYANQVLIVDDIFSLNISDEKIIESYKQFKIKQFSPTLRNCLIKNWINLNENTTVSGCRDNEIYKEIDNRTELVNTTLGKVLNSGIMPAYPFFILSIISTYETFEKHLDQEITSQGYCYQALIYLYLKKQGVKNDDIDTYINFLSEFAFYIYNKNKQELTMDEFNLFMQYYINKYNFPLDKDTLLTNLQNTKIINVDSCYNYSFNYSYLYYFFVAKYIAEHREENIKIIDSIINNLHKNENAYIAIFISHHTKNAYILDEIILNAWSLFDKYKPATLSKEELGFFDDNMDNIVKAVLPPKNYSPEKIRADRLRKQDLIEQSNEKNNDVYDDEDKENILVKDLRRSVKTVEVMGKIIKNRAGSLEKDKLESVFEEAMNVHLRILSSFFELIKEEKQRNEIVDYIKIRLDKIIKDAPHMLSPEQLEKKATTIFWNTNFFVVYSIINKIIQSLGSDKLQPIIDKVCNNINTPAAEIVKQGITMWYSKNMKIDDIANKIEEDGFSETAKRVIKFLIVNHCTMHTIGYRERQKVENRFKISSHKLLNANVSKQSEA